MIPVPRRTFLAQAWRFGAAAPSVLSLGGLVSACSHRVVAEWPASAPALAPADLAWLNRVTFGANTAVATRLATQGRRAFLDDQLHPRGEPGLPEVVQAQVDEASAAIDPMARRVREAEARRLASEQAQGDDDERQARQKAYQGSLTDAARAASGRFLLRAVYSPNQLHEQLTWFWFNHFNVHQYKHNLRVMVADYESVLRTHALGRFADLLKASAYHPAMIRYLDNEQNRAKGLNENYARELLELHTLGVDGGYTQADVQELARVLTGLGYARDAEPPRVPAPMHAQLVQRELMVFNPQRHDFGDKRVLGRVIRGRGFDEIGETLDLLARHPATARFVSRKLAQHFVADAPPKPLVDRMAARFLETDGTLAEVLRTMFDAPEFDASLGRKFKDPVRYVVSAVRLAFDGKPVLNPQPMVNWLYRLGEAPYNRQTPDGYPLDEDAWASPGQMNLRFEIARGLGGGHGGLFKAEGARPRERAAFPQLANALYYQSWAGALSATTRAVLDQAQSPQEWNALFLASPEFMHC